MSTPRLFCQARYAKNQTADIRRLTSSNVLAQPVVNPSSGTNRFATVTPPAARKVTAPATAISGRPNSLCLATGETS